MTLGLEILNIQLSVWACLDVCVASGPTLVLVVGGHTGSQTGESNRWIELKLYLYTRSNSILLVKLYNLFEIFFTILFSVTNEVKKVSSRRKTNKRSGIWTRAFTKPFKCFDQLSHTFSSATLKFLYTY